MKRTRPSANDPIQNAIVGDVQGKNDFGVKMNSEFWQKDGLFQAALKKTKNMDDTAGGSTFGRIMGLNDDFFGLFKIPKLDDISTQKYPITNPKTNGSIKLIRMIKKHQKTIDAVSAYEIGLMFKNKENMKQGNSFTLYHESVIMSKYNYPPVQVEDRYLTILNIQTWNYETAKVMYDIYKDNKRTYFNLTHDSIFADWTVDGVVKHEEARDGTGTFSGIDKRISNINDTSKVETVICHGDVKILNYIGNNVQPGYKVYLIIKKFDAPECFYVSYKSEDGNVQELDYEQDKHTFKPYQIAVIARDGEPSLQDLRYTDERGFQFYGKSIFIGTILHVPQLLNTTTTNYTVVPSTNAKEHMGKGVDDFITIELNLHHFNRSY